MRFPFKHLLTFVPLFISDHCFPKCVPRELFEFTFSVLKRRTNAAPSFEKTLHQYSGKCITAGRGVSGF